MKDRAQGRDRSMHNVGRQFGCCVLSASLLFSGCSAARKALVNGGLGDESRPATADSLFDSDYDPAQQAEPARNTRYLTKQQVAIADLTPGTPALRSITSRHAQVEPTPTLQVAGHVDMAARSTTEAGIRSGTLTVDGKTYRVELVEEGASSPVRPAERKAAFTPALVPPPDVSASPLEPVATQLQPKPDALPADVLPLDLPSVLGMVGGQHPAVGFAQWRVQEAYAQLDQAEVLWLPSLQAGFSFHRHDGNYQASNGQIVDVNRNSFQVGLGAGGVGAGTTPRPGIVAQFHLADAIFQPEIREKAAWAEGHAANGTYNAQLRDVALAYLELLEAEQEKRILEESRQRTAELTKLTQDFAATGQGLRADADRLQTELVLIESRIVGANERAEVASIRLAETMSLDAGRRIAPMDPVAAPIDLVSADVGKGSLISTGLANRPELKEAQALVAAACEEYKRQKYAPFVPSVLLGFSAGGFGGGLGSHLSDVEDRVDFDALMTWEIRNLGLGEKAARRETQARIQQAKFETVRVMDQVASEISAAQTQVLHRRERIRLAESAIRTAQDSFDRNLLRIRDGQGLPIEALQSVQALEVARRDYLAGVIGYNQAQFQLQWALGWPVFAPSES